MLNSSDFDNLVAISNLLNEHNKRQGVAYSAVTYSHPLAGPSNHKRGLHQHDLTRRSQGPETRLEKPREKKYQPIHADSAYSNVFRHRLHLSHAREETGHADIHAAARCAEIEATESKLRAELATAMDRAQTIQEQLQHETKLASSKDHIIQSITEESQGAQTKLKDAGVKVVRLSLDLRLERILRLRERDKHLDQQARMRDCHEDEIRCIAQEAQSVQDKLAALHDLQSRIRTGQYSYRVHLARAPSPLPEAVYAGEHPTSRGILRTDAPLVSPAIDSNSTCSTKMEQDPSHHDWGDPSTLQGGHLLQISACFDQVSHVAKTHVVALEELLERICQLESERAQHVTPTGPDHHSLERELTATMEKLRLAEEEVLTLRRNLDQPKDPTQEAVSQARALEHELSKCQAKRRESEDKRRAMEISSAERLRLLSAELESSKNQVEASQLGATSLSTALQERIDELEAQVTTLKSTQNYPPTTATAINATSSLCAPKEAPRHSHTQGQVNLWTPIGAFHLQDSACHDPESESAQDVTPTEPDDRTLENNLPATIKQLRLVKEEVVALRRNLNQPKDPTEAVSHARDLEQKLRESEDKRQAGNIRFAKVIERLRLQGAALQSSKAEVEALQFKCSQATSSSVALQERINELEAQVTMLRSTHHYPATATVIESNRLLHTTKSSTHSSSPDLADSSTCQPIFLHQISPPVNRGSDVAMDQRAALRESIKRMCQLERESAEDMTPTNLKLDGSRLEEELAATTEQLRHLEEQVVILRHNLDQSRDLMREVESQAQILTHDLETCQAELQESEDKRRAGNIRFVKVVERLDRRSAALKSSRAEVEELQLKCSQATSLSAVQLDRINELEAQVTTLNSTAQTSDRLLDFGSFRGADSGVDIDVDGRHRGMVLRPEPGSSQGVKTNGHGDRRLEEQLATTAGLLRQAEEEVLTLRRGLDQSRKTAWDVETRANDVINSHRTKLSKAEDARRALENKFVEAVENLRLRSAELEASTVEVEASQFKCSQFMFLSAALQDRVNELERVVKLLKGTQDYPAPTVAASPSLVVTDTGMVFSPSTQACTLISDFEDILCNAGSQTIDSAYIAVPSSLPYLPDLSLPDSTTTSARIGSHLSLPRVLTDTGMGTLGSTLSRIFTSDFEALSPNAKSRSFDSIYITISPSLPYLLDLSLPHSSSPSQTSDDSLDFIQHGPSATPPACVDSHAVSPADSGMHSPHLPSFVR